MLPSPAGRGVEGESRFNRVEGFAMTTVSRVLATDAALDLIAKLKARHGPLMFHQSGGCCDGSSPMCYPDGDLLVGNSDVRLGEIGGCPFYMSAAQYEYWKHTELTIDVVPGRCV